MIHTTFYQNSLLSTRIAIVTDSNLITLLRYNLIDTTTAKISIQNLADLITRGTFIFSRKV